MLQYNIEHVSIPTIYIIYQSINWCTEANKYAWMIFCFFSRCVKFPNDTAWCIILYAYIYIVRVWWIWHTHTHNHNSKRSTCPHIYVLPVVTMNSSNHQSSIINTHKTQVRLPKTKLVGILDLGGLSYVIPSIAVPVDVSCHAAVRIYVNREIHLTYRNNNITQPPPPDLLEICLNVHLVFESILPVVRYIQSTVTIARRLPTKELLSLSLLLLLLRILTFTTAKIEVSVIHLEL